MWQWIGYENGVDDGMGRKGKGDGSWAGMRRGEGLVLQNGVDTHTCIM
jgi:hypothetical protein